MLSGAPAIGLMFSPDGSTAYAAFGHPSGVDANGVYKSTDDGATWTPANGTNADPLPHGNQVGRIELTMDPNDPSGHTLYAGVSNRSNPGTSRGIWKTSDGGGTWTQVTGFNYCGVQCWYDNVVRVHPTDPNILLAGGQSTSSGVLFISRNGGATWQNIQNRGETLHDDLHLLAFTNEQTPRLYIGTDGGMWRSDDITDAAVPYANLNDTLGLTQFYPGHSMHPDTPDIGFGGNQDNRVQRYTGSLLWQVVTCGDGGFTAINFLNPSIVYAACQRVDVRRSMNGGSTFSQFTTGLVTSDRGEFIPPMVMDPSDAGRLYFGTYRVYQLTNGTLPWRVISSDLTGCSTCGGLKAIAAASSDPDTVYVGGTYNLDVTTGRVHVTHDALSGSPTWEMRSQGLPLRAIFAFAVTARDPNTAYAAVGGFSGFDGDDLGHVFKTVDAGRNWIDVSGDLPNIPVTDIVIDPLDENTLYVATDVGVLHTTNGGRNWAPLGQGLPNVPVLGLKLHAPTRVLRAGTHGRSMWDFSLGGRLTSRR